MHPQGSVRIPDVMQAKTVSSAYRSFYISRPIERTQDTLRTEPRGGYRQGVRYVGLS